jgi:hypothetical protein
MSLKITCVSIVVFEAHFKPNCSALFHQSLPLYPVAMVFFVVLILIVVLVIYAFRNKDALFAEG